MAVSTQQSDPATSAADNQLVATVVTQMLDVTGVFGDALSDFLVNRKLPNLPRDEEMIRSLAVHATADAEELLVTLRSEMAPTAHEPPVEALAHARYLRSRGVGLSTVIQIYQYGFAMFRDMVGLELQSRTSDPAQLARIQPAVDAYSFPFIGITLQRIAYEYGSHDPAWTPSAGDPVLSDQDAFNEAKQLRDGCISRGRWVASTPEAAGARPAAIKRLDTFTTTLANGVRDKGLHDRLGQASTRVTITLLDEPDVSVTLLLDRSPIEVVDGVADAEAQVWIPSVDLPRLWSPEYYLPMSIAKGRAKAKGPIRKFLRVIPILRTAGDAPTATGIPEIVN